MTKHRWLCGGSALLALSLWVGCSSGQGARQVVVLGVDGLDPQLLERFVREGQLPNFALFLTPQHFRPLQTTTPPLSPVA